MGADLERERRALDVVVKVDQSIYQVESIDTEYT